MRLLAFVVFVLVMLLATCSAPRATPLLVQTDVRALSIDTGVPPTPKEAAPSLKLPAAPFEWQTYINEASGFARGLQA